MDDDFNQGIMLRNAEVLYQALQNLIFYDMISFIAFETVDTL
jgi:hypothetical protein